MAEPQGVQDTSWRTPIFRQKVVAQIDDAMRQSGNPITKSSMEMESHVFQKARTREEYLAMVARLIIHVRENMAKKQQQQQQQQQGVGGQVGVPGGQDPINALQNLTRGGLGVPPGPSPGMMGQAPQGQGMMGMPGQGPMGPGQMQQQQQQQRGPFMSYQNPGGGMPQQAQTMNQHPGAWPPQGSMAGMPQGQPPQLQQQAQPQQQQQPGQQNPMMAGAMAPIQQQQQQQQAPTPHTMMHPISQQYGAPQVSLGKPQLSMASSRPPIMQGAAPQGGYSSPTGGPAMGAQMLYTPPASLGLGQSLPSTGNSPMVSSSAGSLGNMMPSPSPQPGIVPSPATRTLSGIPSPSVPLNTPGNPTSTGPVASPAAGSTEEQAYLEKWKQLQKYIEPLKRMIHRIDKDEDRKIDLKKMTNLLNILSDSGKRLPMATLLKCEQALERLDLQSKSGNVPSVPTPTSTVVTSVVVGKPTEQHLCQPLLDAVAQHIHNPNVNHTLQRTFGPAMKALHGTDICAPGRPAKRQKVEEAEVSNGDLCDVLQGEISRLDQKFRAKFDSLHKKGSNCLSLIFSMSDKFLPSVPPLEIEVPEDYPVSSPICRTSDHAYEATDFLQKVKSILESQVEHMPDTYSITALLDVWEMSVRKACEPVNND